VKDDYKKLSHEWGSKRRKEDSRAAKSTLKKPTREELAEIEFEKVMERTHEAMANPPAACERCKKKFKNDPPFRTWTGNKWVCDDCLEEYL
jgi:hypothetical protein